MKRSQDVKKHNATPIVLDLQLSLRQRKSSSAEINSVTVRDIMLIYLYVCVLVYHPDWTLGAKILQKILLQEEFFDA